MVKVFFTLLLLFTLSFADSVKEKDPLIEKIKSFISAKTYSDNRAYIDIIFSPKTDYYLGKRINAVKVIDRLKENGLLNLFFKKPREITLHFKTSGSQLFFMKLMGDTLRNIGYYRYVTKESNLNSSEFTWTISLISEYATDPLILQQELAKNSCSIVDITRESKIEWTYIIDMRDAELNVATLEDGLEMKLKRSIYAKWINVSKIKQLYIKSSPRNSWHPYIAYYDNSLHLLKVIKKDTKSRSITLNFNDRTHYIKISDIYTLKNIRDDLLLNPKGSR